jgi:hypothetical protein
VEFCAFADWGLHVALFLFACISIAIPTILPFATPVAAGGNRYFRDAQQ